MTTLLDAPPRRVRAAGARRASIGVSIGVLSVVALAACNDDGRDLRDPTFPLPPTTTTSTTLPPDTVAAVGP